MASFFFVFMLIMFFLVVVNLTITVTQRPHQDISSEVWRTSYANMSLTWRLETFWRLRLSRLLSLHTCSHTDTRIWLRAAGSLIKTGNSFCLVMKSRTEKLSSILDQCRLTARCQGATERHGAAVFIHSSPLVFRTNGSRTKINI